MNDDYLKSEEYKKKYEELQKRCADFMKNFAQPSDYERGFRDGWEAAKQEFEKNKTKIYPPIPMPPINTIPVMRCGVCAMEFKNAMGYVCHHPNCPTRVTC